MSTGAGGHWAGVLFQGASVAVGANITPETGISTDALKNMPRGVITAPLYACRLAGGASGAVSVRIFGSVGGVTIPIAGRTAMTTPGNYQVWPMTNGTSQADYGVRPSLVAIELAAGVGISYNATVTTSLKGL